MCIVTNTKTNRANTPQESPKEDQLHKGNGGFDWDHTTGFVFCAMTREKYSSRRSKKQESATTIIPCKVKAK
jgi:hypothetical protein